MIMVRTNEGGAATSLTFANKVTVLAATRDGSADQYKGSFIAPFIDVQVFVEENSMGFKHPRIYLTSVLYYDLDDIETYGCFCVETDWLAADADSLSRIYAYAASMDLTTSIVKAIQFSEEMEY